MSLAGSSVAPSHLSIFAFLANDIPALQLEGGDHQPELIIKKGSRIMLTHFPRADAQDVDHVRFYSNEHNVHGACQPDDVVDFDRIVNAYITLRENQALPYEEEASMVSNDKPVEPAPSITSEQLAEMEAYYSQDPEFRRASNDTVLDVDELANMMSATNTRLEETPIRNPIAFAPSASTPAPPRPPTIQGSVAGKRHMPDSTMLNQEQLMQAAESEHVSTVVNKGIGSVANGMQRYAVKTDENIQRMGQLLSKQMDASKSNCEAITAMQGQLNSIANAVDPEKLLNTMAVVCEQLLEKQHQQRREDEIIDIRRAALKEVDQPPTMDTSPDPVAKVTVEPTLVTQPKGKKPILKKKGRRSARFTLPDSDSDSDSEIAELIHNRTVDPQS